MRVLPDITFGTDRYPPKVARRLQVVNIAAWTGSALALVFGLMFALYPRAGTWPLVAISLSAMVLLGVAPLTHRFGSLFAGVLVFAVGYAALGALCRLLGTSSGLHLFFLVGPALGLLFFGVERLWVAGIWAVVGVSAYSWLQGNIARSTGLIPRAEMFEATLIPAAVASAALLFGTVLYLMRQMGLAEAAAEREQARSEELLASILPEGVAERLKERGIVADRYDEASVLFADMAGFTARSSELEPELLVKYLDGVYRRFDTLVAKHGLEKIKITGDSYMVTSGVPRPRRDHAEAIAAFALDLKAAALTTLDSQGRPVKLRIGIASGPVVAGVIGREKVFYDVWGDTVNMASRMETTSEPGRIQVSPGTYSRINYQFDFVERGTVEVRGKGPTLTWFLESERHEAAAPAAKAEVHPLTRPRTIPPSRVQPAAPPEAATPAAARADSTQVVLRH